MLNRRALLRLRPSATGRYKLTHVSQGSVLVQRALATPAKAPSPNDPFANGTNAYYAEEMYRHWRQDPSSVHASWDAYFKGLDKGLGANAFQPPPRFLPAPADGAPALHPAGGAQLDDHLKVKLLPSLRPSPSSHPGHRCNSLFVPTKSVDITSQNSTPSGFSMQTYRTSTLRNSNLAITGSPSGISTRRSPLAPVSSPTS